MDDILVTILPDGRIKVETGDLAGPLHTKAGELFRQLRALFGGDVVITQRKATHGHHHTHGTVRHSH